MRGPISNADMGKFRSRKLSPEELADFEARLRESGLADDVVRPSAPQLFESVRADEYRQLFEEDDLLAYVSGNAPENLRQVIDQMRRVDRALNQTLESMEGVRRQVETSLELNPRSAPRKRRWSPVLSWGFAAAAGLVVALMLRPHPRSSPSTPPSLTALLSTSGYRPGSVVSPLGQAALAGTPILEESAVRPQLATLATPTKDSAKMSPAVCLVLPEATTKLAWAGIKAKTVTCSLYDPSNHELASAKVEKTSWLYRKPLTPGDYHWSARWTSKTGQAKIASRRFRVVDSVASRRLADRLATVQDVVSRAVMLAQSGYTYDSLRLLDDLVGRDPSRPGLKQLRDSIAKLASV